MKVLSLLSDNLYTKTGMGIIFSATGAFLFSFKAILIKIAYLYHVSPVSFLTLRMVFSLIFYILMLLTLLLSKHFIKVTKVDFIKICCISIFGYFAASSFNFIGLQYISVMMERVILFIYPTFVIIISSVLYKKRISLKVFLAIFVSYSGVVISFISEVLMISSDYKFFIGSLFIFFSAVAYAYFYVGSQIYTKKYGSIWFTTIVMFISTLCVVVHFSIIKQFDILTTFPIKIYVLAIVLSLFSTILPSYMIATAIRYIGAEKSSTIGLIGPVLTLILGNIILKEPIYTGQLVGTIVVIYGVYMIIRYKNVNQVKK